MNKARIVLDRKDLIGTWVAVQTGQDASWGGFSAIGIMQDNSVLAGVVFNNYNGRNCLVHIAIRSKTKLIVPLFSAVCDYAFNLCKLKRITGMVPVSEVDVIAFDKHLGFREEFIMKDAATDGDMQVLVLTPADATRWLENIDGKEILKSTRA